MTEKLIETGFCIVGIGFGLMALLPATYHLWKLWK